MQHDFFVGEIEIDSLAVLGLSLVLHEQINQTFFVYFAHMPTKKEFTKTYYISSNGCCLFFIDYKMSRRRRSSSSLSYKVSKTKCDQQIKTRCSR